MDCPVCREPMIGLEYEKVEVDYCPACAGVWLDEGELEVLLGLEAPEVAALLSGGEDIAADEARRPCPACDRPMVKAAFGARDRVVYDRCPRHHGLFLDRGELAAVIVLNKTDLPGADAAAANLASMLTPERPLWKVSTLRDEGFEAVVDWVTHLKPA